MSLLALLAIVVVSLLIVRVASVALSLTGLPFKTAQFQARSAFTGTGFTTQESEMVVNHPVRRRIIMALMIIRNAGIVTATTSIILSFLNAEGVKQSLWYIFYIVMGVFMIWLVSQSRWLERIMARYIGLLLNRFTDLNQRDFSSLLLLAGNFAVNEFYIKPHHWMAGKTLSELRLRDEGILVLGIQKPNGNYFGTPKGDNRIEAEDILILYGRNDHIQRVNQRYLEEQSNQDHQQAVREHSETMETTGNKA